MGSHLLLSYAKRLQVGHLQSFIAERQGFFLRFAPKALRGDEPLGSHPLLSYAKRLQVVHLQPFIAERQGFEPWVPVRVQRFSRPSRSTAPASVRWAVLRCKVTAFCGYGQFLALFFGGCVGSFLKGLRGRGKGAEILVWQMGVNFVTLRRQKYKH